jgi:lambda family phage tail tape measure protein
MAQTSRLVLEIDSRDAEQKAADTRRALEALEGAGLRVKPAMDKASDGLDEVGQSAQKAGKKVKDQRDSLEALLGSIDPVTRRLGELDKQEKELAKNRNLGLIDADTFSDYQSKINATRADLGRFNADMTKTGISAKQTAAALRGVPAQFTDIAVSLQGGQAPLTVFLQQGGQLKDMFGGAGPAAKALGGYVLGLVNPFTVAAAAAAALGVAYYQGSKEQEAFRNSLIITGNSAGTTSGALGDMAKRIGASTGTVGAAAAALAQLAGTGKVASTSFDSIATAAVSFEKATGQAVSTTIAEFVKLSDDPVKAVASLNEKYNFLTAAVYEQIRVAQELGDKEGAAAIAQEAMARALIDRSAKIKESLGYIETAWNSVSGAAKKGWDAMLGIGREDTLESKLSLLKERLENVNKVTANGRSVRAARGGESAEELQKQIAAVQAQITAISEKTKAEGKAAAAQRDGQVAYEAFQKSVEQNFTKTQKMNKALEDEQRRITAARAAGYSITAEQEETAYKAIRDNSAYKEAAAKKEKAYTENAGIKALDQAKQQYAVLVQQNSLIGAQGDGIQKIGAAQQALIKWEQELSDIKGKKTLTADQQSLLANQQLIGAQLKRNAGLERETELKKISVDQSQKLLAFQENLNSQLKLAQGGLNEKLAGAGLGDQALQRLQEQQQIRQSYQSQMDRLTYDYNKSDKTSASTDLYNQQTAALQDALNKRLTMQTQYYAATDQQQSDWTLGASSAFHTYAEQAANVAGQTRSLFTNAFSSMEDGIVNFVKTGKLSFKDLADGIISDLIRIQVRQAAVGIFGSILGGLGGAGASAASNGFAAGSAAATSSSLGASAAGYSSLYGFSSGGYTGDGGKYQPKGVVHGGEFVVQKSVVQQPGAREFLERMNAGKGYADGGYVNPAGAVTATNAAARTAPQIGGPTVHFAATFTGKPDEDTLRAVDQRVNQGIAQSYNMVLRDFKKNGPISQMTRKR